MSRLRPLRTLALIALLPTCIACVPRQQTVRTSSLDFLYPQGKDAAPAQDVTLTVPARVGLVFAPGSYGDAIDEPRRQELLERIAAAFESRDIIASIEVIPTTYLKPGGSFANLDQLRSAFGVDLITLVSYEQNRFTATTGRSIAYWTIVGAYVVNGEKNETSTVLEAVIYDIPSRALLFRAAGSSRTGGRATPLGTERKIREVAEAGFEQATGDLIAQLDTALTAFEKQAAEGTVRGAGTPAIQIVDASGQPTGGAGALGVAEIVLMAGLLVVATRQRNARESRRP